MGAEYTAGVGLRKRLTLLIMAPAMESPATPDDVIGHCAECRTPILRSHPYSWCIECGTRLPADINQHLHNPSSRGAVASVAAPIFADPSIFAREVEKELEALESPRQSLSRNLLVLVGTLVLFSAIESMDASPAGVVILIVVVFLHEMGHLVAMKVFGYRDVQMFFIPFFGAAVSGIEASPNGTRRAIVALFGPAPGIVFGTVCAVLFHVTGRQVLMDSARTFLFLNTFNLLPFIPLDGGRYLEAAWFARAPLWRAIFEVIAGIGLAALALATGSFLLGIIAFFVLAVVRFSYFSSRLALQVRTELQAQEGGPAVQGVQERIPSHIVERLVPLIVAHLDGRESAKTVAAALRNIWHMVWFKPPSVAVSIGLVLLYVACVVVSVLITFGAEISFRNAAASGL
jgi:Zn-dependent protease